VAVYCCVVPLGMEAFAGVTAVDTNTDAVTVRLVDPLIDPDVAWMVVLPVPTPVARPAPVMVATVVLEEVQITEVVKFAVLLSLYVPVAVYCCVVPLGMEALAGVTEMDTKTAVTVRLVVPLIDPKVA